MYSESVTTCAIMQPTFLPWLGYFNLIHRADFFVFLDDVQLDKRSWQTRNRLFTGQNANWVSCPIKKTKRDTLICNALISNDTEWKEKIIKTITYSYSKAPYFNECQRILSLIEQAPDRKLGEFNQYTISGIANLLGITSRFVQASTLGCVGKRSEHLLEICNKIDAHHYISPQGARHYVESEEILLDSLHKVTFQQFEVKPYSQIHTQEFVSHLSIIDVVANIGLQNTKQHITGYS